jgi:hypothetical protein
MKLWRRHKEDPMKAIYFVLLSLALGACATPSRHPLEEGGNSGGFRATNSGANRDLAGYFDSAATRR